MSEQIDSQKSGGAETFGYRALLEASPNAIVEVDATARIMYVNPQVKATFGYSPNEILGQPVELLLPGRVAERHVAHRNEFLSRPSVRAIGIGLDLAGRRKDGREFPVEISLWPVETADGLRVFATVVDITARKAGEAALAESERRFRAVLEASHNAIVGVDAIGQIIFVNPQVEETFGYSRGELFGQRVELLLPEGVADRHDAHRAGFMAHPVARPMGIGLDLAGRRKDGGEFPVEISLSPVETTDGLQVFATVVDITARKVAETQLVQAQKLESIGRLAGGIAHDFNNMLFAILGYAELLSQDLAPDRRAHLDPETALRSVSGISQAAERAATLTQQLLAFSRRQVVTPRVMDLNDAVRAVEPMLHRLIGENLRLVVKLDSAAHRLRADPGQLDQILVNLVVNARDAMPEGGIVTIETGNAVFDEPYGLEHFEVTPGSYVMLAVSDTGQGMDKETRLHIFEPFFTTKEVGKGTGLGLATIYGIVRQAGGHIWLYSEPGRGTTFKLYFPQVDAAMLDQSAPELDQSSAGAGTVLVVEDETAVRDMTRMVLERAGYRVIALADGAEAMARIQGLNDPVDVLVTDVVMPNMSGIELAERLIDRYPRVGIVLLSGYTAETLNLERITGRGATFVAKPVSAKDLLAAINGVRNRKHSSA
jgi:PAS domain S-box-containing protein